MPLIFDPHAARGRKAQIRLVHQSRRVQKRAALIAPAILSGWLLAFTLSLDDLVISSFVSGPGATTLPMLIFSKVRLGVTPDVNALATIVLRS